MIIRPKQQFKHFKGNTYEVMAIAKRVDNERLVVVYFDVNQPDKVWSRNLSDFTRKLEPHQSQFQEYAFQLIEPEEVVHETKTVPDPAVDHTVVSQTGCEAQDCSLNSEAVDPRDVTEAY